MELTRRQFLKLSSLAPIAASALINPKKLKPKLMTSACESVMRNKRLPYAHTAQWDAERRG